MGPCGDAEPTESEDYDYSGGFLGGGEHYVVTAYDVYDLEAGQKVGSLSREDCDTAVPHGDYLYVEDRRRSSRCMTKPWRRGTLK